jgi:hypothetical protein
MTRRRPLLVLVSVALGCAPAVAGTPEYAVKAGYVYNFAKFIDWPADGPAKRELTVCTYGKTALEGFLVQAVRGKLVHGLPISVVRLDPMKPEWEQCSLIFFGIAQSKGIESALNRLQGRPVVTIGECESFLERGGMIVMLMDDGQIRFSLNLPAIAEAHLGISSRLVELARSGRSNRCH